MNENQLTWADFSHEELGAAVLDVLARIEANVHAKATELTVHRASLYIAKDDRASQEGRLAADLARLQDDQIAIGDVLEEARRRRATVGVGQ